MTDEKFKLYMRMLNEAYDHFCKAILAFKRAKLLIVFALLCTVISAQSFEKINGLGKRYLFVIDTLLQEQTQLQETTFNNHFPMANYFTHEFGLIGYVFNLKKDKCIKMVFPFESVHTYDFVGYNSHEDRLFYMGHYTKVIIVELKKPKNEQF
jgi:hypothetical protein